MKLRIKEEKEILNNPEAQTEEKAEENILHTKKNTKKRKLKKPVKTTLPKVIFNSTLTKGEYYTKDSARKRFEESSCLLDFKIEKAKQRKRLYQIKKMERTKLITMRGDLKLVLLSLKNASEKEAKRRGKIHKKWFIFLHFYSIIIELKKAMEMAKEKKRAKMRKIAICVWVATRFDIYVHGINNLANVRISRKKIENVIESDLSNIEEVKKEIDLKLFKDSEDLVNQRKCGKFTQSGLGFITGIIKNNAYKGAKEILGKVLVKLCRRLRLKSTINSYHLKGKNNIIKLLF